MLTAEWDAEFNTTSWSDPVNWNTDVLPNACTVATISSGYSVLLDQSAVIGGLDVLLNAEFTINTPITIDVSPQ